MQPSARKKPIKLIETAFDICYLGTVLIAGALLLLGATAGSVRRSFGLMALILAAGDACHLIPRVFAMWDSRNRDYTASLGIGKLAASLTMTVFYIILWDIGTRLYPGVFPPHLTAAIYVLAAIRIALCLFPQNGWTSKRPRHRWAVLRNAPFLILGILVAALFAAGHFTGEGANYIWLAVLLSFASYAPVVLFSGRNPKVGMLMLPKSCAYAAIVLMGFSMPGV
jgi:hypothetical protein